MPPLRSSYDAVVIGAGPAGCFAAYTLARGGASVLLFERDSPLRYKTCGGGVVGRAARLLPFAIDGAVERDACSAQLSFLDGNARSSSLSFAVRREEPIVRMTMRSRFDFLLLSEARSAGASVRSSCRVLGLSETRDGVVVETSGDPVRARFAVVAAGAGWRSDCKPRRTCECKFVPALEWEVRPEGGIPAELRESARFDFGVVPRGYGWVFPKGEHLSVGALSWAAADAGLRSAVEAYLARLGVTRLGEVERHGFVIPMRPRPQLACGSVLYAGDAAGLADPLTGEGISFALRSGQLAAEAILLGDSSPREVRRAYQRGLRRDVLGELRSARLLARLVYRHPRVCRWAFRRHGQALAEAVADVVAGTRTYGSLLRSPRGAIRFFAGHPFRGAAFGK